MEIHRVAPDVTVMSDCAEVPGLGFLPVNTFVLHAEQPGAQLQSAYAIRFVVGLRIPSDGERIVLRNQGGTSWSPCSSSVESSPLASQSEWFSQRSLIDAVRSQSTPT